MTRLTFWFRCWLRKKVAAEEIEKARLFDYICWLEKRNSDEMELRGDYVVLASDSHTCWGKTYAEAVKNANNYDIGMALLSEIKDEP